MFSRDKFLNRPIEKSAGSRGKATKGFSSSIEYPLSSPTVSDVFLGMENLARMENRPMILIGG